MRKRQSSSIKKKKENALKNQLITRNTENRLDEESSASLEKNFSIKSPQYLNKLKVNQNQIQKSLIPQSKNKDNFSTELQKFNQEQVYQQNNNILLTP